LIQYPKTLAGFGVRGGEGKKQWREYGDERER